jgi:cytochrome P450
MTTMSSMLAREIPGPLPMPMLGWMPFLLRFGVHPLDTLEELRKKYGNLIRLNISQYPAIIVFDPEYNRQILRDPSAFYSYDLDLVPLEFPQNSSVRRVTNGMPLMNGPRHNDQRTALLPYFHKKFITRYHESSIEITERKIKSWKLDSVVNMRTEMEQLAMWLATAPVLGLDPEKEGQTIGRQLERTMNTLLNPFTLLFPYNIPGMPFHRLLKNAEEMETIVRGVIARKKEEGLTGDDILSIMIQMREQDPDRLSESELIGHTTTMFRGGYNPSGMVLYWALFLLSQHPDVLKRTLAELEEVLNGSNPSLEQLDKLPYLEGVIKETMRIFPAGTWTGRLAMRDFELDSHPLPKGTWVVLSPYITHRLPEVFPKPYKFKPERWLAAHHSSYEFMPFSAGPRYCIGQSLGLLQLKTAMAILLQSYSYVLKPGTKVDYFGLNSIRPKNGLLMSIRRFGEQHPVTPLTGNVRNLVSIP